MHKKIAIACGKTTVLALEIIAIVMLLVAAAAGALIWKTSQGPLDLTFAKDYVVSSLAGGRHGISFDVNEIWLEWPSIEHPLTLRLKDAQVFQNGQSLFSVTGLKVRLAKAPLLIGLVRPRAVMIENPVIGLTRHEDGRISLRFDDGGEAAGAAVTPDRDISLARVLSPDGLLMSILSHLRRVNIINATFDVADDARQITQRLPRADIALTHNRHGLSLDVTIDSDTTVQQQTLSARIHPSEQPGHMDFEMDLQAIDPMPFAGVLAGFDRDDFSFSLSGSVKGIYSFEQSALEALSVDLQTQSARVMMPVWRATPLTVSAAHVRGAYAPDEKRFVITDTRLQLDPVAVTLTGSAVWGENGVVDAALNVAFDEFTIENLRAVWPDFLKDEGITEWVQEKLVSGTIRNGKGQVELRYDPANAENPVDLLHDPVASLEFIDAEVNYRAPLFPVRGAGGTATYDNDILGVTVTQGRLGDMAIRKADITVDNISKSGGGDAVIIGTLDGPLSEPLRYIALEPIHLGEKVGINPALTKGMAVLDLDVRFPTLKELPAEQVRVIVDARLNDVLLPDVVKTLDLSGGPYALSVKDGVATLDGSGQLEGQPITLNFTQKINPEAGDKEAVKVTAKGALSQPMREAFGVRLTEVQGNVGADMTYREAEDGSAILDMKADLTPGRLLVDVLDVEKAPGVKGDAAFTLSLKNQIPLKLEKLQLSAPDINLTGGTIVFANGKDGPEIKSGSIASFKVGGSDARVTFDVKPGSVLTIKTDGRVLDLRPFLESKPPSKDPAAFAVVVDAAVPVFLAANDQKVTGGKLYADIARTGDINQLDFSGQVGTGPFSARYKPGADGRMALLVRAEDAGAALAAIDVFADMKGGVLTLTGEPYDATDRRSVRGKLVVDKFTVVRAPALARLIGIMGLVGMGQLLNDQGLYFEKLESDFRWRRQQGQDAMVFKDGRTSGSSLGLTFDGIADRKRHVMNVEGTIVPVSEINSLIGKIPLIGQILTGGESLIAATYTIKGPMNDPVTSINPLSVLTPGFLRRILFEGNVDLDDPDGAAPKNRSRAVNR